MTRLFRTLVRFGFSTMLNAKMADTVAIQWLMRAYLIKVHAGDEYRIRLSSDTQQKQRPRKEQFYGLEQAGRVRQHGRP